MSVYGLIADLHLHAWSAFSHVSKLGVNNRLEGLLSEIERAADEVKAAGGQTLIFAGDVFHVRGSVSPVVLNSTRDCLQRIVAKGMSIVIMPGNHDLEGKESTRLSSAVTALEMDGVGIINQPYFDSGMAFIPWVESVDSLKSTIEGVVSAADRKNCDLFLHAPIDGVIKGLPSHGLTPEWLASLGFKRVLSGHYHNHKRFDGEVYSIGALAHHTWSDVGSKAGYLLVHDDRVDWRKSHLPEFIDLNQLVDLEPEEIPLIVDGNFVRVKVEASKSKEVEKARSELLEMGAKAVIVQAQPKPPERAVTGGVTVASGASLEVSVSDFVRGLYGGTPGAEATEVTKAALDVLTAVDSMGD